MSHPDIHTALMRERQNTFLAQAETDRRARQARLARRAGTSRASGSPLSRVTSRLRPGRLLPGRLMPGRPRWATK
jgi:hypothetical protein